LAPRASPVIRDRLSSRGGAAGLSRVPELAGDFHCCTVSRPRPDTFSSISAGVIRRGTAPNAAEVKRQLSSLHCPGLCGTYIAMGTRHGGILFPTGGFFEPAPPSLSVPEAIWQDEIQFRRCERAEFAYLEGERLRAAVLMCTGVPDTRRLRGHYYYAAPKIAAKGSTAQVSPSWRGYHPKPGIRTEDPDQGNPWRRDQAGLIRCAGAATMPSSLGQRLGAFGHPAYGAGGAGPTARERVKGNYFRSRHPHRRRSKAGTPKKKEGRNSGASATFAPAYKLPGGRADRFARNGDFAGSWPAICRPLVPRPGNPIRKKSSTRSAACFSQPGRSLTRLFFSATTGEKLSPNSVGFV